MGYKYSLRNKDYIKPKGEVRLKYVNKYTGYNIGGYSRLAKSVCIPLIVLILIMIMFGFFY